LKATCWDSDENKLVEFSSVLVDAATGHPKSTFHKYVIPTENQVLSDYCKNYNGIKQKHVTRRAGAVTLSDQGAEDAPSLDISRLWRWPERERRGDVGSWDCRTMLKELAHP
jgi:inhibitor of KinA sporulation pathway (predicted exonuclease)